MIETNNEKEYEGKYKALNHFTITNDSGGKEYASSLLFYVHLFVHIEL